jgi:hypothetical protein
VAKTVYTYALLTISHFIVDPLFKFFFFQFGSQTFFLRDYIIFWPNLRTIELNLLIKDKIEMQETRI